MQQQQESSWQVDHKNLQTNKDSFSDEKDRWDVE